MTLVSQMPGKWSSRRTAAEAATSASRGASAPSAANSGIQVLPSWARSGVERPT